jgi:hypothetical protein
MNQKARQIYQQLVQDIILCKQKDMDCRTKCECCFRISEKYWWLLKEEISGYAFASMTEEIDFFKNIKPLFTGEIEYYRLLLNTTFFRPDERETEEIKKYWLKQANRLGKFISEHFDFCFYMKNHKCENDHQWFVRANSDLSNFVNGPSYDTDSTVATSHDYLVAQLLAFEKYAKYSEEKFKQLVSSENILRYARNDSHESFGSPND